VRNKTNARIVGRSLPKRDIGLKQLRHDVCIIAIASIGRCFAKGFRNGQR
jgi:hypothetical protein